jgi:hypothetical protein
MLERTFYDRMFVAGAMAVVTVTVLGVRWYPG